MIENTLRYGQTSISVPDWATHIAWDKDGEVWVYGDEPIKSSTVFAEGCWNSEDGCMMELVAGPGTDVRSPKPPEPGPWYEQLYELEEF